MKIRKLQLKDIGVFDDETIEFPPCPVKDKAEIHIFTGQNGSGKTTLLMALASLFRKNEDSIFSRRLRSGVAENEYIISLDDGNDYDFSVVILESQNGLNILEITHPFSNSVQSNKRLEKYVETTSTEVIQNVSQNQKHSKFDFAAFAYSGYRRIKDEPIEIGKEIQENPLYQALDFVKDENSKLTVNQWLGQNLINNSLAKTKGKTEEANGFDQKVRILEKVINDIIVEEMQDNNIKFEMQSATKLVLIKDNQELDFDVLPDGLKSLISWIGDLLMRLDSLQWENDTPIFDREIILFLDEIEVHLHPAWQRKVLPVVQKLFKNSQIFVSTHSPFVVNSVDDAWVYKLELENGKAHVSEVVKSEDGISYQTVLSEIFGIDEEFGGKTQEDLDKFYKIVRNGKKINEKELLGLAKSLAVQSEELNSIVQIELRQLSRRKRKEFSI